MLCLEMVRMIITIAFDELLVQSWRTAMARLNKLVTPTQDVP